MINNDPDNHNDLTTIMENKFNDNELDRWLREHAEAPASDGWDTPSEAVWTGLRTGLDARKKRRRFFLLLWFGLLAGLLGGIGFWQFQPEQPHLSTETSGSPLITEQKTNTLSAPISSEKSASPSAAATPADNDNPGTSPASGISGKTTTNHTQIAKSPTPEPVNTTTTRNSNSIQSTTVQTTAQVNTTPPPAATQTAGSGPKISGSLSIENKPQQPQVLQPGPTTGTLKNQDVIAPNVPALLPTLPAAPLVLLPIRQQAFHPEPIDLITPVEKMATPGQAGWYAGAVSGMFFTSRNLQTQTGQALNGTEAGTWTWQQGIQFGRTLNAHWAIESGLQRSSIQLQAERQIHFQYRTDREKFNADRYLYQSSTDQVVQTSFGEVEMWMDMGREPSRPILNLASVDIILRTNEQVNFLRIPVLLRYQAGKGPWQWSLNTGLGINLKSDYTLSLTAARANRPGVRDISARVQNRPDGLAPVMLDAQFGAGLQYRLAPNWALELSPQLRYGISSINRNSALKSYAISSGLQLGLNYTFH
ncbi:MAG: outer membrane beta-barrel protein [Lewinellaceae bacterium]|nr:outer membrane beta-barrel protein [Lewinellaceae bacterium]